MVALDFSRSMLATDIYPSRLERSKRELGELLATLGNDRVGVVAFAGETLTYPPTTDYAAIKLFWLDLHPWDMPVGGTAIGRAIRASLDQLVALRSKPGASDATRGQAILLLTDGEDNDSEPLEAADEASKLGVKIFTVGVGSRSGELIPEYDQQGKVTGYVKDADGKYVTSRLGEQTLVEIARRTGGEVFYADSKRFGVEDVAHALSSLKRTENDGRPVPQYDEAFQPLLFAILLALCAEVAIGERRRRGRAGTRRSRREIAGVRADRASRRCCSASSRSRAATARSSRATRRCRRGRRRTRWPTTTRRSPSCRARRACTWIAARRCTRCRGSTRRARSS